MAEIDSSLIKSGFWINHAQGSVLGATITTDQQAANVLIALLAVVVSVAAGSAWNLILFAAYQTRSTASPRDGLFRQQQVLYRALAPPTTVFVDSLKLLYAWRMRASRPLLFKCLLPALLGLLFALAALAAGLSSSYIVSTTDLEVLVAGDECRLLNWTAYFGASRTFGGLTSSVYSMANSFAQQCYAPGPVPSQCDFYVHPRIEPTIDHVDCPFGPDLCITGVNATVLDSGLLDSSDVLGLNAPARDRVSIQRKTTCAPLDTPRYTSILNGTDPTIAEIVDTKYDQSLQGVGQWWMYEFGQWPSQGLPGNATLLHDTLESNVSSKYDLIGATSFQNTDFAEAGWGFNPVAGLAKDNSDVTLVFVFTNRVASLTPIDDPIYSAHVSTPYWDTTAFIPDHSAGVLGCIEEYGFCVRNRKQDLECTPKVGATTNITTLKHFLPFANEVQLATLQLLASGTAMTGLASAANSGPHLNVSSHLLGGVVLSGVPPNQWVLDFQDLENLVWAFARVGITSFATGFAGMDVPDELFYSPTTDAERHVCRNQKVVKAGGFANVSVFGLSFTLVVAGIVCLMDLVFLRVYILHGRVKKKPGVKSWIDDGIYQLQRRVYELYEGIDWEKTDDEIPVTARGQLLKGLSEYNVSVKPGSASSSVAPSNGTQPVPTLPSSGMQLNASASPPGNQTSAGNASQTSSASSQTSGSQSSNASQQASGPQQAPPTAHPSVPSVDLHTVGTSSSTGGSQAGNASLQASGPQQTRPVHRSAAAASASPSPAAQRTNSNAPQQP